MYLPMIMFEQYRYIYKSQGEAEEYPITYLDEEDY
jgi:hypothetical protein